MIQDTTKQYDKKTIQDITGKYNTGQYGQYTVVTTGQYRTEQYRTENKGQYRTGQLRKVQYITVHDGMITDNTGQ